MADSSFEKGLTELSKMKVADLKAELKQRGLPTTGNKTELVERLQLAIHDSSLSLDENADEILNEDAILGDEEIETEELSAKPDSISAGKKPLPPKSKLGVEENNTPTKKVILNRKTKIEEVKVDEKKEDNLQKNDKASDEPQKKVIKLTNENTEPKTETNKPESNDEKKIIKLSELTSVERLEMRAKKFGVPLSDAAKKEARAARFSNNNTTSNKSAASIKNTPVPASYEVLKKRAERFGTNVSSLLEKAEMEAKKEQRKARFGEIKPVEKVAASKIKLVK